MLETLVGAMVLAIAVGFVWYAIATTGTGVGRRGYELHAQFDRINGLGPGSDVRVSGIKVGSVTGVELDPKTFRAAVRFSVPADLQLPDDSVAEISSEGLLGGFYLNILPGTADATLKPGGTVRYTQAAVDLLQLIGRAIYSLGEGRPQQPGASPPGGQPGAPAPGGAPSPIR